MKILVACEFSGIVRDEFRALGHDAISCDLEPSERPGPHYQGDVRDLLGEPWDMMVAFPPCTHLSTAGVRFWPEKQRDGRQAAAVAFFLELAEALVPRIAIENPVGIMSRLYRRPDCIIEPWQFGDSERKRTCLWLKGLPPLLPMMIVGPPAPKYIDVSGKRRYFTDATSNWGGAAGRARSRTFPGIARAMARQWGTSPSWRPMSAWTQMKATSRSM